MGPDMQHCEGGTGPNRFDALTALEHWVENNQAPDALVVTKYANNNPAGVVERTMPVCAFPTQATYAGTGDVNVASHWSCAPNRKLLDVGPNGTQAGLHEPVPRSR